MLSWLGVIGTALGLLTGIPAMIRAAMQRRAGRAQQAAADDAATIEEAKDATRVESAVDRESRGRLIDELQQFSRDG